MGVPGSDDVMLNYQSTSYHDAAGVRELVCARPAPEFASWLEQAGIFADGRLADGSANGPESLQAFAESVKELGR
jgi:ethanolamine ammonia-lyase large subunit